MVAAQCRSFLQQAAGTGERKNKVQRKSESDGVVGCLRRRLMNCRGGFCVIVQPCVYILLVCVCVTR